MSTGSSTPADPPVALEGRVDPEGACNPAGRIRAEHLGQNPDPSYSRQGGAARACLVSVVLSERYRADAVAQRGDPSQSR